MKRIRRRSQPAQTIEVETLQPRVVVVIQLIHTNHHITATEKGVTHMTANETRTAGDENGETEG